MYGRPMLIGLKTRHLNPLTKSLESNKLFVLDALILQQEMSMLVRDPKKNHHKFPQMSSYHRMLVHRLCVCVCVYVCVCKWCV